ncbi:hypothetical protein H5410_032686 [Solanum commersonii]|uniref:Uncharacterized protein n=1 Tax=Solanum commersonii TaxID=4109 RepID=A0A9J5YQC4_SOLCO|nr:hypothetical protein H5410_032686 [Solanum commersonii]
MPGYNPNSNGSLSGISSRCIVEAFFCVPELELYKLIPPRCIIGALDDEDPYDDLDEPGDDLSLPRGLCPFPRPLVIQGFSILQTKHRDLFPISVIISIDSSIDWSSKEKRNRNITIL